VESESSRLRSRFVEGAFKDSGQGGNVDEARGAATEEMKNRTRRQTLKRPQCRGRRPPYNRGERGEHDGHGEDEKGRRGARVMRTKSDGVGRKSIWPHVKSDRTRQRGGLDYPASPD